MQVTKITKTSAAAEKALQEKLDKSSKELETAKSGFEVRTGACRVRLAGEWLMNGQTSARQLTHDHATLADPIRDAT